MKSKSAFTLLFIPTVLVGIFIASEVHAANCASIPAGGDYTVNADCSFPGTVNGIEGHVIIASGRSLTIQAGQTFVWNPGKSITITGSIVINSSGQLRQTYLWMEDGDGDGYLPQLILM